MTPQSLKTTLDTFPADMPLVFETDRGAINGGYHVTELKLARINSIDCGARRADWTEATLQLLDGHGGAHMTVGRFNAILAQSIRHVDGLADAPLNVEFANGNAELRVLDLGAPTGSDHQVTIPLGTVHAVCKPAAEASAACCTASSATGCCA